MTGNKSSATPKKILVVEDENFLRDLYVQILKDEGFQVDQARDGEEAFQMLSDNQYDLTLLDVIIPNMDGLQVLEALRKANPEIKNEVVLLTNLGQDLVIAKALEFGVRGYIIKSDFTPDELIKEIRGYLDKKEKMRSHI